MGFLRNFMRGRNGLDTIFYFCFVLYLVIWGLNLMFASPWLYYIGFGLLFYALFRFISRNVAQRQKENEAFTRALANFFPNFAINKKRLSEGKTHVFHECPYCGAILRFERKRGKFNVTCPKCKHKITIRNWF